MTDLSGKDVRRAFYRTIYGSFALGEITFDEASDLHASVDDLGMTDEQWRRFGATVVAFLEARGSK